MTTDPYETTLEQDLRAMEMIATLQAWADALRNCTDEEDE